MQCIVFYLYIFVYLFILFLNILIYQELETCSSEEGALSFSAVCCPLEGRSQAFTKRDISRRMDIMKPQNHFQLQESPCPFVRNKIWSYFQWEEQQQQQQEGTVGTILLDASWIHVSWRHASWTHLRGSHGLSARRAQRTKSSRPEGPQARSWGPTGR